MKLTPVIRVKRPLEWIHFMKQMKLFLKESNLPRCGYESLALGKMYTKLVITNLLNEMY